MYALLAGLDICLLIMMQKPGEEWTLQGLHCPRHYTHEAVTLNPHPVMGLIRRMMMN